MSVHISDPSKLTLQKLNPPPPIKNMNNSIFRMLCVSCCIHIHVDLFQEHTHQPTVPLALSRIQLASCPLGSVPIVRPVTTANRQDWPQKKETVPRDTTVPQAPPTAWRSSVPSDLCVLRVVTSLSPVPLGISPTRLDSGNVTSVPMGKIINQKVDHKSYLMWKSESWNGYFLILERLAIWT